MKNIIICMLIFWTSVASGQHSEQSILQAPENWKSEVIPFPISFAPSINYTGFEEIRFAEGWSDENSPEFWAYTFVWYIDEDPQLTAEKLESDIKNYYDGLMDVVNKDKETINAKITKPSFRKSSKDKSGGSFVGKFRMHDSFFTKKKITLNALVHSRYCKKTNKYIIRFNLSPHPFDHAVWHTFDEVKVNIPCD